MLLFDAKKLWVEGGYVFHNPYETFIARVRDEARNQKISQEDLDLILIDFFMELREDPMKYRTEGNKCEQCSCVITNSGTNATHYIFNQIRDKKAGLLKTEQDRFTLALNNKIAEYIKRDNEEYIEQYGPKEEVPIHWTDKAFPTFKSILGWNK